MHNLILRTLGIALMLTACGKDEPSSPTPEPSQTTSEPPTTTDTTTTTPPTTPTPTTTTTTTTPTPTTTTTTTTTTTPTPTTTTTTTPTPTTTTTTTGPTSSLFLHFPFDGDANDVISGITPSVPAGASLVADRFGNADSAYQFSGDHLSMLEPSNLDTMAGLTISAYVKQTAFSNGNTQVVAKWNYTFAQEQYGWFVNGSYNLVAIGRANNSGSTDGAGYDLDTWYHVAVTYDKATSLQQTYINGELFLDDYAMPYSPSVVVPIELNIGGITGILDDVKLFDRALTADEIGDLADELNLPAVYPNDPMVHFPFDGDADDVVQGLIPFVPSTATLTTDRFGQPDSAYHFDSTNMVVSDDSNLDDMSGFTISAFMQLDSFTNSNTQVVTKWSYVASTEQFGWFVNGSNNLIAVGRANPNGTNDTAGYSLGQWYHVVVSYDKATSTQKTYVDGVKVLDSVAGVYSDSTGANIDLLIGGVDGSLDDVKIFDRALSDDEVQFLADEL